MKTNIVVMKAKDYEFLYGADLDVGVRYVYFGVYEDDEVCEETSLAGWVFEDGTCMIVGCRTDYKCDFDVMYDRLDNELANIAKCYTD